MNLRASLMAYRRLHEESVQHPDPSAQTGASAVKAYYAFVTQSYLRGWGESFHLAPRQRHESRMESLHRLEYYLAARLGLTPGQHVLDVGCGVGGPMRSIARFSGATVTGITISPDQVAIGNKLNRRDGLARQCTCLEGDFMTMQLPDASFDAAYTIEALCHATDRAVVFSEIHRVLRPAGLLVGVDQCMTSLYDDKNEKQRRIKRGIELGSGIANLTGQHELKMALQTSGFELIEARDLIAEACQEMPIPWYAPLLGQGDGLRGLVKTRGARGVIKAIVLLLEQIHMVPSGSYESLRLLNLAADSLIAAGKAKIFTPSFFFLARKL